MARALILAAGLLALAASAGAAQTVGVSAVVVDAVEAAPVEYEVQLRATGYEVKVKRAPARRSLLIERTIVNEGAPSGTAPVPLPGGMTPLQETTVERTTPDRVVVTRVIAANA